MDEKYNLLHSDSTEMLFAECSVYNDSDLCPILQHSPESAAKANSRNVVSLKKPSGGVRTEDSTFYSDPRSRQMTFDLPVDPARYLTLISDEDLQNLEIVNQDNEIYLREQPQVPYAAKPSKFNYIKKKINKVVAPKVTLKTKCKSDPQLNLSPEIEAASQKSKKFSKNFSTVVSSLQVRPF
ncbi:hypothetical protein CAPTEDRAFT_186773 [Capitella teleta]|uniref:Uncharacterized protein n=1 Tax=Capitella teleta TaxID=283909 RepID=R7UV98_CAPTE|nr:hypothetical protein CAPTEDRAFT_186773 [Capitella teleta]|eukprot:ELU07331.1 hypothetical protein CAPTEDRAFT_186773 [Capitella teleta]